MTLQRNCPFVLEVVTQVMGDESVSILLTALMVTG